MNARIFGVSMLVCLLLVGGSWTSAKEPEKKSGKVIGTLKSQTDSKDGKNTIIEVLAPGEEKARSYHVMWDAKLKAPNPEILKAVRAAKVGNRVELEWIQTGHGPAISSFRLFGEKKDEKK